MIFLYFSMMKIVLITNLQELDKNSTLIRTWWFQNPIVHKKYLRSHCLHKLWWYIHQRADGLVKAKNRLLHQTSWFWFYRIISKCIKSNRFEYLYSSYYIASNDNCCNMQIFNHCIHSWKMNLIYSDLNHFKTK